MPQTSRLKAAVFSAVLLLVSMTVALGAGEIILRIKNSSMKNYDIEMWRYAKDLKYPSPDPILGHEHVKNASAVLQSVTIRTDEWGLRGGPVPDLPPGGRRILFLGSSITLGWGVPEEQTMTSLIQKRFDAKGENVQVLNAGIGNYNAQRYVERFMTRLEPLHPTDIVVCYFLRDAEQLDSGGGNFLLRNSELAVTLWIALNRLTNASGESSLVDHYHAVYDENAPGLKAMRASLLTLSEYARSHHVRIYMAMTPDVHNLGNYPFTYIHDQMHGIARDDGFTFIDLLPAFRGLTPQEVWAMPGDPHPNALGHRLMADAIFPVIENTAP